MGAVCFSYQSLSLDAFQDLHLPTVVPPFPQTLDGLHEGVVVINHGPRVIKLKPGLLRIARTEAHVYNDLVIYLVEG